MADVQPLQALHYDLDKVGGLQPVAAPPYDVIDAAQRAELVGRSPYNVVEVDLPENSGGDIYDHAAHVLARWHDEGGPAHRLWRVDDADAIETYRDVLRGTELLIADGHHRYETARVYQQEV